MEPLLVACLCAAWCGTCRDYAPLFRQQAAAHDAAAFYWVDIEDHEEAIDGIDVENFPTLLIARGDHVLFFGPVTPHGPTLARLLQAAQAGDLTPVAGDAAIGALPARVRRFGIELRPDAD